MSRYRFVVPVLLSLGAVAGPSAALGQVAISVNITIAPPPLPVYVQPPLPEIGYIWSPGYWAYGPDGYYWVPGTWVQPPQPGLLWTPGWWGWNNGVYLFNEGYWGPTVGFYGGVNYGYGYGGNGYQGGYWNHGAFFYNRAANNFGSVHITNIYNRTIINNTTNHVSFNGGQGGITARPTAQQLAYQHAQHTPPTALQVQHRQAASGNHDLLASVNNGRPPIAATAKPAAFTGAGVVPARAAGGPYHPAANAEHGAPTPATTHPAGGTAGQPGAAQAEHGAPGPAITHPAGGAPEHAGAAPALRTPAETGHPEAAHPEAATPGAAPALRTPTETGHPEAAPHEGAATPEIHGTPTPETHPAPTPTPHPAPAPETHAAPPVHPEAAPAPAPHPAPAPAPHPEAAPAPHPAPAPAPHPQAAPAPHPESHPAPAHEEEKKPQ